MTSLVNSFKLVRKSSCSLTHFFVKTEEETFLYMFYEFSTVLTQPPKRRQSKANNPHEKGSKILSKRLAKQMQ